MNTDELEKLVFNLNCKVVSLDQLPQHESAPEEMYIINTEQIKSNSVGHWMLISKRMINGKTHIIFFDSLGLPAVLLHVINYINKNIGEGGTLVCNKYPVQLETSASCGRFVTLLASHLNNNLSYDSFLHAFSSTPAINEKKVREAFVIYKQNAEPPASHLPLFV
jgi:hypothetical protein